MYPSGSRHTGIALVALSAVLWSTAGLFVRMADLDAWTVLGWRSLFSAVFLGGLFLIQSGPRAIGRAVALGWSELFMIATSIMATICYVFALKLTTVANVMTIYATLPFVAAGIAFVWLGERASVRILVASAIALVGIAIMAGSATDPKDIAGNLAAFAMTVGFGTQLVHAKQHPDVNMTLVIAIAAGLCAVISWPLMAAAVPSFQQLMILAAFGILTTGVAYTLALDGSRRIGSGEAGFISMLDVILGPLWVWLFFAEQPSRSVLVGGVIVLASALWYLARGLRTGAAAQQTS